jgi:hypothetical protein
MLKFQSQVELSKSMAIQIQIKCMWSFQQISGEKQRRANQRQNVNDKAGGLRA